MKSRRERLRPDNGTRVLLREPSLRQALTLSFAAATAGAAAIVVTVAYVCDVLGRGETAFAIVMAGLGFTCGMSMYRGKIIVE